MKVQIKILLTLVQLFVLAFGQENYEANIVFVVHKAGSASFTSDFNNNSTLLEACPNTANLTIVVTDPGYDFSTNLINAFHTHRGGCVMWMDFSYYKPAGFPASYGGLFAHYEGINAVLVRKLWQLEQLGYVPADIHMFGFSFGSYQAITAGFRYGPKKIGRIDACDPSSDTWVANTTPVAFQHANDSAIDVQCIHTTAILGTTKRFCPKSINMGKCGTQPLEILSFQQSHELCVIAYISSFTNNFKLVSKAQIQTTYSKPFFPVTCTNQQHTPTLPSSPAYTMGYRFDFSLPDGEYYADLKKDSPYYVV
ncbi:uncharacterized protein LOC134829114 [Culicoides brevitarsis]|uniref:uncharacterized protein LOC134829114 n=1 Tax=Culicoides brevitarsis TaxID=469753 RepID=UPI00307B5101